MPAEPCKKCGMFRLVDIVISSAGWHQPQCYYCGDPAYVEPMPTENQTTLNPYSSNPWSWQPIIKKWTEEWNAIK